MKDLRIRLLVDTMLEESDYQRIDYFAKQLGVSNKSVYNYLNELDYLFIDYNVEIEKKPGVGIKLNSNSMDKRELKASLFSAFQESKENRKDEIYDRLVLNDEVLSIRKLSEEYFVSTSSIVSDLEAIERKLSKHGLELHKDKKGTKLGGSEQNIRNEKFRVLNNKIQELDSSNLESNESKVSYILKHYIDESHIQIAEEMIAYIIDKLDFTIENNYYMQILIYFSIFSDRIKSKEHLKHTADRPIATELHILKTYPIATELANLLDEKYGYFFNDLDIRWMNARIGGVYHERNDLQGSVERKEIKAIVQELVVSTQDIFKANLLDDTALINGLEKHFIPLISRVTNNVKIHNPLIEQIKDQYTAMFSVVWLASSIIERELDVKLSEDEISFLLIHFQAALERRHLSKKIAVVSQLSGAAMSLLMSRIKSNIPTFDILEHITYNHIDELDDLVVDFDFVITTERIEITEIPVVRVGSLLNHQDIDNINAVYFDERNAKKQYSFDSIVRVLHEDTILVNREFKDKYEILSAANEIMLSKGLVSEQFYESMLDRESSSPTEIGKGIVIPHGKDEYVNQTSITLITLKEPIMWENDLVRIVFVLAINLNEKDRARKLFKDLYYLISSESIIDNLCTATSASQIIRILDNSDS